MRSHMTRLASWDLPQMRSDFENTDWLERDESGLVGSEDCHSGKDYDKIPCTWSLAKNSERPGICNWGVVQW
jgi:hypothetical protein